MCVYTYIFIWALCVCGLPMRISYKHCSIVLWLLLLLSILVLVLLLLLLQSYDIHHTHFSIRWTFELKASRRVCLSARWQSLFTTAHRETVRKTERDPELYSLIFVLYCVRSLADSSKYRVLYQRLLCEIVSFFLETESFRNLTE